MIEASERQRGHIAEACDAITAALVGVDLDGYKRNRLVRSSVEREFIVIGEAISAMSHAAPDIFTGIARARRVVDRRNQPVPSVSEVCRVSRGVSFRRRVTMTHRPMNLTMWR